MIAARKMSSTNIVKETSPEQGVGGFHPLFEGLFESVGHMRLVRTSEKLMSTPVALENT